MAHFGTLGCSARRASAPGGGFMSRKRSLGRAVALLLAVGLAAAACGDDGGGSKDASGASGTGTSASGSAATTTLAAQKGGTLTVGMFSYAASLDPAKSSGSGTAG